jgi:hypothetical protein
MVDRAFSSHCGAKTFFLGEYGAVATQRALVWLTEPVFSAHFGDKVSSSSPLSPPCKRLLQAVAPELLGMGYQFTDPYQGRGGLGASSAEFLLWMRAVSFYRDWGAHWHYPAYWSTLLDYYTRCSWSGRGVPPSGVDVVAQNYAGLVYIDVSNGVYETLAWPFSEVGVALAHTNQKLATHLHLEDQVHAGRWAPLSDWVEQAREALHAADLDQLIASIRGAYQQQLEIGLVAAHTQEIVSSLQQVPVFLAAKGCGAMGSDVILALYPVAREVEAIAQLGAQGLEVLTTLSY